MTTYKAGDRISILYLSTRRGTCLAYNRDVIEVEAADQYTQRLWVSMPPDCAYGTVYGTLPHPDFIEHMDAEPVERQSPGRLIANADWHMAMSTGGSMRTTWPAGRHGTSVYTDLTAEERRDHATKAIRYVRELRANFPREYQRWITLAVESLPDDAR
ncbi:hypothetical protein OTB20_34265 [Streptomyces sp. H27-H1]|uniref:hypothetical protein n=1 Tax=unclassified Streptomyces TaxID=2593676 RepID=UPI00226F6BED|nr:MULTISPECIES: hypothetical protein [unclassified Streptomyces]MCY0931161.1 hypothetical protein [Streptomyces sp. H27-H1]MCY0939244.1 hypothetical protein [Streptomyces sp. H34-S4]